MPKTVGYDTQTLIKILSDLDIDLMDIDSDAGMIDALKEGAAKLQVGGNTTDERYKIITGAVKHLRSKRKEADPSQGMQITNKKISAEAFKKGTAVGGAQKVAADTTGASSIVPYKTPTDLDKSLQPEEGKKGGELTEFQGTIEKIAGTVDSIHETLLSKGKKDKVKAEADKKADEDDKRGLREKLLESKGFKMLAKGVGKVLAPVQSMFGKVINFISSLIMGKVLINILDWWSNPANKAKADAMIRFVGDWWPVFAAGILLFGTGLGGLITGLIAIVTPLIPLLLGAVKVLMLNPWVAGAVALGLGAWGIHSLVSSHQSNKAQKVETGDDLDTTPSTEIQAGATQDRSAANKKEQPEQKFAKGGLVQPLIKSREYSGGGKVSGPSGVDKVPAKLTAGEFVMSRGAVQKWGVGTLAGMNAAGGGTNKPKMGGYEGGGEVSPKATSGNDKFFNNILKVQQFLIQNVGSSDSLEKMGQTIERVREITSNVDINSVSGVETPAPPETPEQKVIVTPSVPSSADQGGSAVNSSPNIPVFDVLPGWNGTENKIKVLGFIR